MAYGITKEKLLVFISAEKTLMARECSWRGAPTPYRVCLSPMDGICCVLSGVFLNETLNPPHAVWGLYFYCCILLQLFRSRPLTDGTRGVSTKFRDQHVFLPKREAANQKSGEVGRKRRLRNSIACTWPAALRRTTRANRVRVRPSPVARRSA